MTKSEYFDTLKKATSYNELHSAIIFHLDPVMENVDSRVIYSKDRFEVRSWLDSKIDFYRKNNIQFQAFLDGQFEDLYGDISRYLEGV